MKERRKERLASFIQENMPAFFKSELELPAGVFVSVVDVEMSVSGSKADVLVSVFPDGNREGVAKLLKMGENRATRFVQRQLNSKHSPLIRFIMVGNPAV